MKELLVNKMKVLYVVEEICRDFLVSYKEFVIYDTKKCLVYRTHLGIIDL